MDPEIKEQIDKGSEVFLWTFIEEAGGFIWRMNHEIAHGRIESTPAIEQDILNMREYSQYCVGQLYRFGILDPVESKDAQDRYWEWYRAWKDYFEQVSDGDLDKISKMLQKDPSDPCEGYRPASLIPGGKKDE
jgi:hypothetical protein